MSINYLFSQSNIRTVSKLAWRKFLSSASSHDRCTKCRGKASSSPRHRGVCELLCLTSSARHAWGHRHRVRQMPQPGIRRLFCLVRLHEIRLLRVLLWALSELLDLKDVVRRLPVALRNYLSNKQRVSLLGGWSRSMNPIKWQPEVHSLQCVTFHRLRE